MLAPAPGIDLAQCIATFGQMPMDGVQKDTADLMRYDQIIRQTKPTLIIETGTDTGASAGFFADHGVAVVTIDIDREKFSRPERFDVERLCGDSTDPAVLAEVKSIAEGRRVMVSLDSDHSEAHVREEIELYAPLVSVGCYLVIEDGIFSLLPPDFDKGYNINAGVLEAITATMLHRKDFDRDVSLEAMFPVTGSPAGWWRRTS